MKNQGTKLFESFENAVQAERNTDIPVLIREDGEEVLDRAHVSTYCQDHYRFRKSECNDKPLLLWFNHDQHHTRLDVTELEDHLLISFDADLMMVGITYCGNKSSAPYVLHNKQRYFLLVRREGIQYPEKIKSFRYDWGFQDNKK